MMTAKQARTPTRTWKDTMPRHEVTGEPMTLGEFMEWQDRRIETLESALKTTLYALENGHKPETTIVPAIQQARAALQKAES